ncbi:DedA family protein [Bacillus sp. EB01]|uniref:DedA family protein n=1 Tax=Bacillus sp. EB01 TaxID=1347086 RepID=UPI0006934A96|nr:DedA family protein [Bacillus sp. EB01]
MQHAVSFMNEYGYMFLFISMALGMIILPVPLEALLGYSGYLSYTGELQWLATIAIATIGTFTGMIANYWIGKKLGYEFIAKYGHYVYIKISTIEKIAKWFNKYGNKLLILIFFIPGARHAIGFFAGITKFPPKLYCICTATGAFIWSSAYILIGNLAGPGWELYNEEIKKFMLSTSIVLLILLAAAYLAGKSSTRISGWGWRLRRKLMNLIR